MTPDGHFIGFTDTAGSTAGKFYIWDSQLGEVVATNIATTPITRLAISPDGNRIAYLSGSGPALSAWDQAANQIYPISTSHFAPHTTLRFSADGRFLVNVVVSSALVSQVYLFDFQAQTNLLVSHDANSSAVGSASSDSPDISADGHFVVYRSAATNLVAGATNGATQIFLFDVAAGTNSVLSAGSPGDVAADNGSFTPLFSGDGHALVFASWGTDLVPGDFNQYDDLFNAVLSYLAGITTDGVNLTISWPASTNQTYSVQYKDDLTDPTWSTVPASVTINGNLGYLTDPLSASGHRFYRVVLSN
jgi:hypothetical protein